jgi:hypothetical protein
MIVVYVSGFVPINGQEGAEIIKNRWGYGSFIVCVSAGVLVGLVWCKQTKSNAKP